MKILFDNQNAQEIQCYLYDCLKAAHARMVSLAHDGSESKYPWRTGAKQVNVIGVRGFREGVVRTKNLRGLMDDTIFVARINPQGQKEVKSFIGSLDYSSGNAPILMDGCHLYTFGSHGNGYKFEVSDPGDDECKKAYSEEDLFPKSCRKVKMKKNKDGKEEPDKDEAGNVVFEKDGSDKYVFDGDLYAALSGKEKQEFNEEHRYCKLPAGPPKSKTYRALVSTHSLYVGRDVNQDNVVNPGEKLGLEAGTAINIHYGGSADKVKRNSAGCQVIQGWGKYTEFMRLLESDSSLEGVAGNELEAKPKSNGTEEIVYTLMEGAFFEHFLQSQSCMPVGEPRSLAFGTIHPFEHLDTANRVQSPANNGQFLISGNAHWHTGVHFEVANSREKVLAAVAGEVIAARFGRPSGSDQDIPFGSANFVLMRCRFHRIGEPVFLLYMNLGDFPGGIDSVKDVPWLNRARKEKDFRFLPGRVKKLSVPVLPGELLGLPGKLDENLGVHFEVFSAGNIFEHELKPLNVERSAIENVVLPGLPGVSAFTIVESSPGSAYALPGQQTRFSILKVANGASSENLARIRWKIRVISESGEQLQSPSMVLDENDHSIDVAVPEDERFHWTQIVAQPYLEGGTPDPRCTIYRYIFPSKLSLVSDLPQDITLNAKKIADCLLTHFPSKSTVRISMENAQTCAEVSSVMKKDVIWSKEHDIRRLLGGMILFSNTPWSNSGGELKKRLRMNGFRDDSAIIQPYQWWDEALERKVPIPAGARIYQFNPLNFLRSLPAISDSLHWMNENSLIIEGSGDERDHYSKEKEVNRAPDAAGVSHIIGNHPGLSRVPDQKEW
ncbi:MAG: hypothetical protein IPK50_23555 [Fibrobacterota bacterium]|nr:MAG: hypothetical protein IPK50_23555 [Fibrobacterota bacterium]